ncbi:hypothetical protein MNBD_GAMMA10-321 [hydrothermal vent metagenome]|uniref:Uncharacterized protein n=1 Tax=hydrothermal vent metagenome TaxID=652676 RepID=A0A3B0XYI4_9ZZZZ
MIKKIVVVILAFALVYFFFIKEDLPKFIEFQGNKYGPRDLMRGNDSNSKMFRYSSESKENSDYIILLKPDSDSVPSEYFAELFSGHFAKQGFAFKKQGDLMMGIGSQGVIYMVNLSVSDVVVMLVVEAKAGNPKSILEAESIFSSLSEIQL